MAEKKETPMEAPKMLEADTRADLVKKIGDFVTANPGSKVSVVQYDGNRKPPFWVDVKTIKS